MSDVELLQRSIDVLESEILAVDQVDLSTTHELVDGLYARTIFIPAGTVLTGAAHKTDHINIMVGDISVAIGVGVTRLTGYNVFKTLAGARRAGYAHSDTHWTTVCHTHKTDLAEIENDLVEMPEKLQTSVNLLKATVVTTAEK